MSVHPSVRRSVGQSVIQSVSQSIYTALFQRFTAFYRRLITFRLHEQFLLPLRDSRAKPCQAIFAPPCVCFSLDYPRAERETAHRVDNLVKESISYKNTSSRRGEVIKNYVKFENFLEFQVIQKCFKLYIYLDISLKGP